MHALILSGFYLNNPQGFLSSEMMMERMWALIVGFVILALIWTYFFNRFASEKNVMKGIHHGVSYMLFLYLPTAFINYSVQVISGWAYLWWLIAGLVMGVVIGAVQGVILKEKPE
ncbi:MAG: hypothetical protein H8E46_03620 [FCB group bacterium]|nr:hypothetical protein [FCB group bacterium]